MKVFCHAGCTESWREDRRSGMIYPAVKTDAGMQNWFPWHVKAGLCPYCGRSVVRYRKVTKEAIA